MTNWGLREQNSLTILPNSQKRIYVKRRAKGAKNAAIVNSTDDQKSWLVNKCTRQLLESTDKRVLKIGYGSDMVILRRGNGEHKLQPVATRSGFYSTKDV